MDCNSIIGLFSDRTAGARLFDLHAAFGQQLAVEKHRKDSLEQVERQRLAASQAAAAPAQNAVPAAAIDSASGDPDSLKALQLQEQWGAFASAATGSEQLVTLENDKIRLTLSSLGGKVKRVELKDYKTWDGRTVELMSADSSRFDITFPAQNRIINTGQLNLAIRN